MAPQGVEVGVIGMVVEEVTGTGVAVCVGKGEDVGVTGKDPPGDAHPVRLTITTRIENNKVDFIRTYARTILNRRRFDLLAQNPHSVYT